MFTVPKLPLKNKLQSLATAMPPWLPKALLWLPFAGLVVLLAGIALICWQLHKQGVLEGTMAWHGGRYVEAYVETGRLVGHLLPPPPESTVAVDPQNAPKVSHAVIPTQEAADAPNTEVKLRPAPNMALGEESRDGLKPAISKDGVTPWQYYARPFTRQPNMAMISVVVVGLGIHHEMTTAAARLPSEITLSLSPYAANVPVWMQSMRVQGHEFMLELPLEPHNFPLADPGPEALLTRILPEENMTRLGAILAKTTGYIGFTMPADEVFFSGQKDFVEPVIKEISNRGLLALFSKAQERPELITIMKEADMVRLDADINIRYGLDSSDIGQQLAAAEAVALKRGQSLVVIHASPIALQELQKWTENLASRGFQLAPVSALASEQFS